MHACGNGYIMYMIDYTVYSIHNVKINNYRNEAKETDRLMQLKGQVQDVRSLCSHDMLYTSKNVHDHNVMYKSW